MKAIYTQIEITAAPDRVWRILTNFSAYQDWNPFIRSASCAELKPGALLEIALLPPGGEGWTFRPTVKTVHPERELKWLGRFILPGLFDGEHCFTIESLDPHHVRFVQSEQFHGLLVPFFGSLLDKTSQGFEEMNHALKSRAESTWTV
jgi:hypothetical protein